MFCWEWRTRIAALPRPLQGAGAIPAGELCPTALSWLCPGPGRRTLGISPSVLLPRRVQGAEFLPYFASRQSPVSPHPDGLPTGMFVQGHVPGQCIFPCSGRGAGGSSESGFQGRTNFRRRSVFRRQPGHVSGDKCSCNEAVLTRLARQRCSITPQL